MAAPRQPSQAAQSGSAHEGGSELAAAPGLGRGDAGDDTVLPRRLRPCAARHRVDRVPAGPGHDNRRDQPDPAGKPAQVTSWAAIIAVPTAITGFYGQNRPYRLRAVGLRDVLPPHSGDLHRAICHVQNARTGCSRGPSARRRLSVITVQTTEPGLPGKRVRRRQHERTSHGPTSNPLVARYESVHVTVPVRDPRLACQPRTCWFSTTRQFASVDAR